MAVSNILYRYLLPKKAIKGDCPQCSPKHRKTLSRFVDRQTNEPLPEIFGRCDRESNCGYFLSPYHKGVSGLSYADEQRSPSIEKKWFQLARSLRRKNNTQQQILLHLVEQGVGIEEAERVCSYVFNKKTQLIVKNGYKKPTYAINSLPYEVLERTLGKYERNEFAHFLATRFGYSATQILLHRFKVGTSRYWPGACVFWLIDEQERIRGGQIVLYDATGHKVKYVDQTGKQRACITSVRHALTKLGRNNIPPDWLSNFAEDAETWPVVFGLSQLKEAQIDTPIAIVEGPKTAIVCTYYMPDFIWLAVGGKSYLKPERLDALRGRKIQLFPDLNAYEDWQRRAEQLRAAGFSVSVSDVLEQYANDEDRKNGFDLADFLLKEPTTTTSFSECLPGQRVTHNENQVERLVVESCDNYPPEWDRPNITGAKPTIKMLSFDEWQHQMPNAKNIE